MTDIDRRTHPATEPLLTRGFLLLGAGELAYFVADGITIYLVPVHATGQLGAGRSGAGLAFGAFALSALLLRPWAGRLCDTLGRRPLLVGGALVAVVSLAATSQVTTLAALVALRLLAGVAEAVVLVAAFAAVADLAPPSRLGEALSYNSLALYVGIAAGPPLGEGLVALGGPPVAWYGAAGLALVSATVLAGLPETRPGPPPTRLDRPPLLHRASIPVALGFLSSVVAMAGLLTFAALHATDVGLEHASLPLVVYGAVVVVGRIGFAKLPDRLPPLPLGTASLCAIAAGLALAAVWATPAGLVAGAALTAAGVTFSTPAFFSAVFTAADPTERGAVSATTSVCVDLGLGLGPIVLGVAADRSGIPAAFGLAAGVALLGAAWTWRLRQDARH